MQRHYRYTKIVVGHLMNLMILQHHRRTGVFYPGEQSQVLHCYVVRVVSNPSRPQCLSDQCILLLRSYLLCLGDQQKHDGPGAFCMFLRDRYVPQRRVDLNQPENRTILGLGCCQGIICNSYDKCSKSTTHICLSNN